MTTGLSIPQIGLGLWQVKDEQECITAVKTALENGYRHFDTAQAYGNEEFLGKAIKSSGIDRKDVFITTKIAVQNFVPGIIGPSFEHSLKKLQSDYVDLLLLHFPVTGLRHHAWKKLESWHHEGKAKSIGVSNYTIKHLEKLLKDCDVKPVVNQVELHVFLQQSELVKYCYDNGIVIEAYSPLAHGNGMDDPTLVKIAGKHGKSTAQIMLRWCVERGFVVLPKSVHADRIKENVAIFDFKLDDEDLKKIAKLERGLRTCWDPTRVP